MANKEKLTLPPPPVHQGVKEKQEEDKATGITPYTLPPSPFLLPPVSLPPYLASIYNTTTPLSPLNLGVIHMRLICQNDIVGFRHSIVFGSVRIQLQAQAPRLVRNSFRGHGPPLVPASKSFATYPMFTLRETMRDGCDGGGGGLPTTQHSTTLFHRCDHQARWPDGPSSSSCTEGGLRWPLAVLALTQFNFAHADTEIMSREEKKLTGITKAKKFNLDISRTSYCRRSLLASSPPDSESVRLQNVVHVSWGTYTRYSLDHNDKTWNSELGNMGRNTALGPTNCFFFGYTVYPHWRCFLATTGGRPPALTRKPSRRRNDEKKPRFRSPDKSKEWKKERGKDHLERALTITRRAHAPTPRVKIPNPSILVTIITEIQIGFFQPVTGHSLWIESVLGRRGK
ncbi:hypothetical protein BGY98DRAFT_936665 [Russula aff. rugulosa BPL654]|nr:hypothetical protein BGY98DRAFT_936665 [Russula aff. rugulosa BPL654]